MSIHFLDTKELGNKLQGNLRQVAGSQTRVKVGLRGLHELLNFATINFQDVASVTGKLVLIGTSSHGCVGWTRRSELKDGQIGQVFEA
jgi:hypothetical protein